MADDPTTPTNPRTPIDLSKYAIHLVRDATSCRQFTQRLRKHCTDYPVLGFDCEWRPTFESSTPRRKVALLQLASAGGLCMLVQLTLLNEIPSELRDLLGDPGVLKVGVEPMDDGAKLAEDYELSTRGTLDLRCLARQLNAPEPYGLKALAKNVLGCEMDKRKRVVMSNWEREILTRKQIAYAAKDAIVALEVFRAFNEKVKLCEMDPFRDVPFTIPKVKKKQPPPQPSQQPPQHRPKRSRGERKRQAQQRAAQQAHHNEAGRQWPAYPSQQATRWQAQRMQSQQLQGQLFTEF